jgi:hypothetical protein
MFPDDKHAVLFLVHMIVSGGLKRTGFFRHFIEAEELLTAIESMKECQIDNEDLKAVVVSLAPLLRIARGL